METISFTRKELYDLVWSKSLTALAKEYELNYTDLRKACIKNDIPIPENGYWSKIKFGKPVNKPSLPIDSEKESDTLVLIKKGVKKNAFLLKRIKEIESIIPQPEKIPERLTKPDDLVVKARKNLKGKKPSYRDCLIHTDADHLRISVSSKNIQRALRIADLIIKTFKSLGIEFKIKGSINIVVILGEQLAFSIQENITYRKTVGKYRWDEREMLATDLMSFRYWLASETRYIEKKIISDGVEPLENKMLKIITGLESLAQKEIDERLERERYRSEQDEKRRIEIERIKKERELIRQQKQDDENFETLLNQAQRWQKSKIIREYLNEIESQGKKHDELTPELTEWLKWAREKTHKYDPLAY